MLAGWPGRLRIIRVGICGNPGLTAQTGQQGHLTGKFAAQGIERRDLQTARMFQQVPLTLTVAMD